MNTNSQISQTKPMPTELLSMAASWLEQMYDYNNRSFCNRVIESDNDTVLKEGCSRRYTLITLLGAERYLNSGRPFFMDPKDSLLGLLEDPGFPQGIGDLGLLLWLTAISMPEQLPQLYSKFPLEDIFKNNEYKQGKTMELAWLLTGLSESFNVSKSNDIIIDISHQIFRKIIANNPGKGLFGHSNRKGVKGILRGHIGSFADQVYPIIALSKYGKTFSSNEAINVAKNCAETICRLQGSFGQWWWHYDSTKGLVFNNYPVYSVHQDAMAPMALYEIGSTTGIDYTDNILLGLQWIFGRNERELSMVNKETRMIYRSFYKSKIRTVMDILSNDPNQEGLTIRKECRPYHLGWILFAFSHLLEDN